MNPNQADLEVSGRTEMKEPLVTPGHSFASVTDKIASIVLTRKTPFGWFVAFAVAFYSIVVGAYTLSNSVTEVIIMIGFGIAGFLMRKAALDPAPLVLAFVLGNILETNFRQALLVGRGTLALFYTRPIAVFLLAVCVALVAWQMGKLATRRRKA